jgi:hypothetical protein
MSDDALIAGCCVDIDGHVWHERRDCPNEVWRELWADVEHTNAMGEIHRPGGLT